MTIQEAIIKIQELGFSANLWEKHGKKRIYVEFYHSGSKKTGGFTGKDGVDLVAQCSGRHTQTYQDKLDQIAKFQIEWTPSAGKVVTYRHAMSQARKENEHQDWMDTHDL